MFKNLLDKGKCSLGFHDGEWSYEYADECVQLRICVRCQTESRRTEHSWGEWDYVTAGECDLARICPRCGETESRVEHNWGEAEYKQAESCEQVHICQRCGQEKAAGFEHRWDQWAYLSEDDCTQLQYCGRCSEQGRQKRINHDWGAWQHSDFYSAPVAVCRHCAEMIFDLRGEGGSDDEPSLQVMDQAVERLLAAGSIEALYHLIDEDRQTLFSPVREKYFQFAFDQYAQEPEHLEALQNLQGLLLLCQQQGLEAAFAELTGSAAQGAPPPGPAPAQTATQAAPASRGSATEQVDMRLVGRYRHTDSTYSDGFSMATDTHMILGQDGRFSWSSESAGSFGSSQSGPDYGRWAIVDGQLCLLFDDGNRFCEPFELSADSLFLPQQGHYRLWTRY